MDPETNRRLSFCLCRRMPPNSMQFERIIAENDMVFDGYWPDRFDSNRGVSPLLTALNEGADVRETWEWLVVKAKASAVFGLAFTRTSSDDVFPTQGDPNSTPPASETAAYTDQVGKAVKARGLINLDLDPGDDVKEIQSSTPNPTVIPFTRELIRSVLLALDIPFTFYDSLTASFSARIADRNEYEESCEWKRDKNISVLDEIYGGWLIPTWYKSDLFGFGKALDAAKLSPEEVAASLRWVPAGRPWLDRSNEMSGHILALAAGVTSTPRICAAYGDDAYEIAEEQKEYLAKAGIPLLYAQGGQVPVNDLLKQVRDGQVPTNQEPKAGEDTDE
jgi:capsid protein